MTKLHKKKANILGKKIPVLLLVGVLAFGLATAALLPYIGTITGNAVVDQSVTLNGEQGGAQLDYSFDGVAGDSFVDGPYTLENNMDESVDVEVRTTCENSSEDTGYDQGEACEGIDTKYVEYFDDAGHEWPSLDDYSCDVTVDDSGDTIQDAIDDDNDVICVEESEGPYGGFHIDRDDITVVSNGAKVEGQVKVSSDNVVIEGFEVHEASDNGIWLLQGITDATIKNNHVYESEDKTNHGDSSTGIYLESGAMDGTVIEYNTIETNYAGIGGTEDFQGAIQYNVFKNNDEAIGVGDDEFSTEGNVFEGNVASFRVYGSGLYDSSSVDASDNYFADGFNVDMNGNDDVTVDASYKEKTDFNLDAGETDKFGVVNDFAINLVPDTYTIESVFDWANA